jgi:glutamate racemase
MDPKNILKKIKKKYRNASLIMHPDKNIMNISKDEKTEMFQKLKNFYDELIIIYTHYLKINDFIAKYSGKKIDITKDFKDFIIQIKTLFFDLNGEEESRDKIDELLELYKLDQK